MIHFYYVNIFPGKLLPLLQNLGIRTPNDRLSAVPERVRLNLKLIPIVGHHAVRVGEGGEAQGVQGHLQLGRGADKQTVHRFVQTIISKPHLHDGPLVAQVQLPDPALVVDVARLLHLVHVDPVVHSDQRAVLLLRQHDVLEARGPDPALATRVHREPDGL